MEHVRMGDNDRSPHLTKNPAMALTQADPSLSAASGRDFDAKDPARPSLPPSTTNLQYDNKSPPGPNPLFRGFEKPSFFRIVILTVLCPTAYLAFYILTFVARDKSLTMVRLVVSAWCLVVGFVLGHILLTIGAQHLEAATWATVIHKSREGDGMKLRDLAKGSDNPTSFIPAFHIFRSRFEDQGTARRTRKSYDKRPWSLFLGFFVVLTILAPLLPFLFGRVMVIETYIRNQRKAYREILIAGDLSEEDVRKADSLRIRNFLRSDSTAFDTAEFDYGNDTVYFAQPTPSQFVPGGSGAGTFNGPTIMGLKGTPNNTPVLMNRGVPENNTSAVLRFSQWGIRIHCEKLPNPEVNLVYPIPGLSTSGVAFVPRDFLRGLFGAYGVDLPTELTELPEVGDGDEDPILSRALQNVDLSTISYFATTYGLMDGVLGLSLDSNTPYRAGDQRWMTVETVFIQLNTTFTPSGHFPSYSNGWSQDGNGTNIQTDTQIGHDAAVCVQMYEPWITEAYSTSTGSAFTLRIVDKGNSNTSLSPSGSIRGPQIANTRYLNTTGKDVAFSIAHSKSVARMWEANIDKGSGIFDTGAPSAVVVSFTNGTGPEGYTELSPDRFAVIRARVSAANALPYLAGSGPIVAQVYWDDALADTTYNRWLLIGPLLLILILGIIGELFVPTLPLNIPRRKLGVYSWLALFQSQELRFEAVDDLKKFMSLNELEERFSDKQVKFTSLNPEQDDRGHDNA